MTRPLLAGLMFVALCLGMCVAVASAHDGDHGATYVFQNVTVGPGEEIDGDLTVIFGDATIYGVVHGDVTVVGGTLYPMPGCEVDGRVTQLLGNRQFGEMAPWFATPAATLPFAQQKHRLMGELANGLIVLFVFLLFPMRVRIALERVERHPGLSAATGLVAVVAILPLALLLLMSIVGIPLIAVEVAAVFAGVWIGQGAIALLVGRRLYELVVPHATPTPLGALILGLVVVCAAEIVPVVGWFVTILVWLVGLGAAILAFIRTAAVDGFAPVARAPGSPIGGSPMNPA